MKKLLQKIISMAVVVAVLCPSISSAEGSNILKGGGGLAAVIGAIGWYLNNKELDDCRALGTDSNVFGNYCTNEADLENKVNGFGGLTAIGVGAFALGSILDSSFQVRPIQNGIAIERDGFSFSAAATGKVRLQKRWEF